MVSFSKHAQVTFVENPHVKIIVHFSIIINRINRTDLTATIPDVSIPFDINRNNKNIAVAKYGNNTIAI